MTPSSDPRVHFAAERTLLASSVPFAGIVPAAVLVTSSALRTGDR